MAEPNPVSRVVGAPATPASSTGQPVAPAARAARPAAGGLLSNRSVLMLGGAALVAIFALWSRGRAPAAGPETPQSYEIDTRDTDLYNDLQPELENISDQLGQLLEDPRPVPPTPVTPTKPAPPKPAPKPAPAKPVPVPSYASPTYTGAYVIQKGDTLDSIAKKYGTTRWGLYSYKLNTDIIEIAARNKLGKPSQSGKLLVPGTTIYIPDAQRKKYGSSPAELAARLRRIQSPNWLKPKK